MMRSSSHGWALKALREAADAIARELYATGDDDFRRRPQEEEWCLAEIIAHLRDVEGITQHHIQLISEGGQPELPVVDTDALVEERDYRSVDPFQALEEFLYQRQETVLLLWSLPPHEWSRQGLHPYRGALSIAQLAKELADHDLEHLWQIRRVRRWLAARV